MRVISNYMVEMKDGTKVTLPEDGTMKLSLTEKDGKERLFVNGKELVNGKFKVTFTSIIKFLFD